MPGLRWRAAQSVLPGGRELQRLRLLPQRLPRCGGFGRVWVWVWVVGVWVLWFGLGIWGLWLGRFGLVFVIDFLLGIRVVIHAVLGREGGRTQGGPESDIHPELGQFIQLVNASAKETP